MATLTVGQTIERYKILKILGTGGFGTVYKAQHQILTVIGKNGNQEPLVRAIKELHNTNASVVSRFIQEASILIEMSKTPGANFTQVFDLFELGGRHFLVMEYVPGGTLEIPAKNQIPEHTLASILVEVCKGLEIMHNNVPRVIHRDLKPANIKVEFQGFGNVVKILDFGVSYIDSGNRPPQKEIVGTPSFAGPDQMMGKPASHFMDLFSLGSTAYFCMMNPQLTEEARYAPFPYISWSSSTERDQILGNFASNYNQLVTDYHSTYSGGLPSSWNSEAVARQKLAATPYSPALQNIVLKLMSANNRFNNVTEVRQALEPLAGIKSTTAAPWSNQQTSQPGGHQTTQPSSMSTNSPPPPPPPSNSSGAFLPRKKT